MEQDKGRFIGIDLAKKSREVCILEEGKAVLRSSYKTDAAGRARLGKSLQSGDTVAVEACALAFVVPDSFRGRSAARSWCSTPASSR